MTTSTWPRFPSIYEINTWVWLAELTKKAGHHIDLSSVPSCEWDDIAALGCDAVWLMGVWERSPAGTEIANRNPNLLADFRRALPDFRIEDNVGSPYCIRRYVVDEHLGGRDGLARARSELARRGTRLLLDFVPNHVAPDHDWTREESSHFIQGTAAEARQDPASFVQTSRAVYACGRDPYFPAWPDVLQLNAFHPGMRAAGRAVVMDIATQCDGVRCDMAMLVLNDVFERTWGLRAGPRPATEFWSEIIPAVKQAHPNFRFIAEAYWDLEWQLQQLGFDFCYDKRLYDRLEHENAESVRLHLCADTAYQERLVRFIENHDEPRAASAFSPDKARAAAVVAATLPGARLFHQGQLEGRRVRLPVFLGRAPEELKDDELRAFYAALLASINRPVFRGGQWRPCERSGWPDNTSHQNLLAWRWQQDRERFLIVVNLSAAAAQARVQVDWDPPLGDTWSMSDRLSGRTYERSGEELRSPGVYVELPPWGCHLFECRERIATPDVTLVRQIEQAQAAGA